MLLDKNSYFSKEADLEYMSVSQYKNFKQCEAKALNDLQQESQENKQAFIEGHFFEELVAGDANLYIAQHPEMISSRGSTAGQLKAEYKKAVEAAEKFKEQELFRNIIAESAKQVIMTGEINGVPVKCCHDLLCKEKKGIYDIKYMKDFTDQWSKEDKRYIPWYYAWGYVLQLAVYQEIVRQNLGEIYNTYLMAATKENTPDIAGLKLDNALLELELEDFKKNIKHYDNIKKGIEKPVACGCCDYCKRIKKITQWEEIK